MKLLSLHRMPWIRPVLRVLLWLWIVWVGVTVGYCMGFEDGGLYIIDQLEELLFPASRQTHARPGVWAGLAFHSTNVYINVEGS